eukprot:RCo012740
MATAHTHCFVGNIGFDVSEKDITELLERCGRVRNFRVVTDPATGKTKGYGFVEFDSEASALCAIKNLNGMEFRGRQLKVDFADHPKTSSSGGRRGDHFRDRDNFRDRGDTFRDRGDNFRDRGDAFRDRDDLPPGSAAAAAALLLRARGGAGGLPDGPQLVVAALNTIPVPELYEAVEQLRSLAITSREQAKSVLYGNPQLGLAVFHVLHHMGVFPTDPALGIPECSVVA